MMQIDIGIVLGILAYILFTLFILALCSANKVGMDEQAENEEQAKWLQEHSKHRK